MLGCIQFALTLECRFRLGFTDFLFARFQVPNENAPRHEQMVQVNLEIVLCPDAKKCGGFQGKVAVRKYAVFINCSSAVS